VSRIFISHSSKDNRQAIALHQWLIGANSQLDGEIFLDLHGQTGIAAGEKWKDALGAAADRCEAVICLLSPNWEASPECWAEFRYAEYIGKRIFTARISQSGGRDPTLEWQQVALVGDGPTTSSSPATGSPGSVAASPQRASAPRPSAGPRPTIQTAPPTAGGNPWNSGTRRSFSAAMPKSSLGSTNWRGCAGLDATRSS
jgi:hypothetical protein